MEKFPRTYIIGDSSKDPRRSERSKHEARTILKEESSSCRCSTILIGQGKGKFFRLCSTSEKGRDYAKRFPRGHWSFLCPAEENTWYETHTYKPDGKWNEVADLMVENFRGKWTSRSFISHNALGKSAQWCEILAQKIPGQTSSGQISFESERSVISEAGSARSGFFGADSEERTEGSSGHRLCVSSSTI